MIRTRVANKIVGVVARRIGGKRYANDLSETLSIGLTVAEGIATVSEENPDAREFDVEVVPVFDDDIPCRSCDCVNGECVVDPIMCGLRWGGKEYPTCGEENDYIAEWDVVFLDGNLEFQDRAVCAYCCNRLLAEGRLANVVRYIG